MTPTQRSLHLLRADGWLVAVVEKWIPRLNIRQDLFGFADLLAVRGDEEMLVQTTSGSNVAHRLNKIRDEPKAGIWLASPHRHIEVHGWRKAGERGKRKTWQCRVIDVNPLEIKLDGPFLTQND